MDWHKSTEFGRFVSPVKLKSSNRDQMLCGSLSLKLHLFSKAGSCQTLYWQASIYRPGLKSSSFANSPITNLNVRKLLRCSPRPYVREQAWSCSQSSVASKFLLVSSQNLCNIENNKSELYVCKYVNYLCHEAILRLQGLEGCIGRLLPLCIPIIQIPEEGTISLCS